MQVTAINGEAATVEQAGMHSPCKSTEQMHIWFQLFRKQDSSKTDLRSTCMKSLGLRRVREDLLGSLKFQTLLAMLPMSARLAVLDFSILGSTLSCSSQLHYVFQAFPKICKIAQLKACFSIASHVCQ